MCTWQCIQRPHSLPAIGAFCRVKTAYPFDVLVNLYFFLPYLQLDYSNRSYCCPVAQSHSVANIPASQLLSANSYFVRCYTPLHTGKNCQDNRDCHSYKRSRIVIFLQSSIKLSDRAIDSVPGPSSSPAKKSNATLIIAAETAVPVARAAASALGWFMSNNIEFITVKNVAT